MPSLQILQNGACWQLFVLMLWTMVIIITTRTLYTDTHTGNEMLKAESNLGVQTPTREKPQIPITLVNRKLLDGLEEIAPWREFDVTQEVTDGDTWEAYHRLMNRMDLSCSNVKRVGAIDNGGWEWCMVEPFAPQKGRCLVYSFGIAKNWFFDDAVSKDFHCINRAFDPTIALQKETNRTEYIRFYPVGLAERDGEKKIMGNMRPCQTLGSFRKRFGETDMVMDYLKMDIESSEWPSLRKAVDEGSLKNIKQLGIEYHFTRNTMMEFIQLENDLGKLGFRKWKNHWNNHCDSSKKHKGTVRYFSVCNEVYYLNINYLTPK